MFIVPVPFVGLSLSFLGVVIFERRGGFSGGGAIESPSTRQTPDKHPIGGAMRWGAIVGQIWRRTSRSVPMDLCLVLTLCFFRMNFLWDFFVWYGFLL